MLKQLAFAELRIGQQLVLNLAKNIKLPDKLEGKNPRFLVLDQIANQAGEKVLIPAFTLAEIKKMYHFPADTKQSFIHQSQNFIFWNSLTASFRTDRYLDFNQIYLLDRTGILKKMGSTFQTKVKHYQLYNQDEKVSTYDFTNEKIKNLKIRVAKKLELQDLVLKSSDLSVQRQSSLIDDGSFEQNPDITWTFAEKVDKLRHRLNKINADGEQIAIPIYYFKSASQPLQSRNINEVIDQTAFTHLLQAKTQINFSSEELNHLKFNFELVADQAETNQITGNLIIKYQENGKAKTLSTEQITLKVQPIDGNRLLANLYHGILATDLIGQFRLNQAQIDEMLNQKIKKIQTLKKIMLKSITYPDVATSDLLNQNVQSQIARLMAEIEFVNKIQKVNFWQKKLLASFRNFLIKAKVFSVCTNLSINLQQWEKMLVDTNDDTKMALFTKHSAELQAINQLIPWQFRSTVPNFIKLFAYLNQYKQVQVDQFNSTAINSESDIIANLAKKYLTFIINENYQQKITKILQQLENQKLSKNKSNELEQQLWSLQELDLIIDNYFPERGDEPNFALDDYFMVSEQEAQLSYYDKLNLKFEQVISQIIKQQILAKNLRAELLNITKTAQDEIRIVKEQQRVIEGDWKIGDSFYAQINNIPPFMANQKINAQVIEKSHDKWTIIYTTDGWQTAINDNNYQFATVAFADCVGLEPQPKLNQPSLNGTTLIRKNQAISRKFINWKYHNIVTELESALHKLAMDPHFSLFFNNANPNQSYKNWEITENQVRMRRALLELENLDPALKNALSKNQITINFTTSSKKVLSNLQNANPVVSLDCQLVFHDILLQNQKTKLFVNTNPFKFQVNHNRHLVGDWLESITNRTLAIKQFVAYFKQQKQAVMMQLLQQNTAMSELVKSKFNDLLQASNHLNYTVDNFNVAQLQKLKQAICLFQKNQHETIKAIAEQINPVENFTNGEYYQQAIDYYQQARTSEDYGQNQESFANWDEEYRYIKTKMHDFKFESLDFVLTNLKNNLTIFHQIKKIKFKKLSWCQKLGNWWKKLWKTNRLIITKTFNLRQEHFTSIVNKLEKQQNIITEITNPKVMNNEDLVNDILHHSASKTMLPTTHLSHSNQAVMVDLAQVEPNQVKSDNKQQVKQSDYVADFSNSINHDLLTNGTATIQ